MKHLFARTAVFAAVASAAMVGGLPAHAAATSSASYTADRGDDGLVDWWEELWFGEKDDDNGFLWRR
ncbi:hypothetical protein [Actinomadura sp. 9N407]|uniref:hypothetical protein n=1 Tax=Actinomadura sp. 9N407 TaxID=3375154 RepID=UPI0037AD6C04